MKKFLHLMTCITCLMIMISISPKQVKALTGDDGVEYPDFTEIDDNNAYLIYKDNNNQVWLIQYPKTKGSSSDTFDLFISASSIYFGSPISATGDSGSVHLYKLSEDGTKWIYRAFDVWGCTYNYTNYFDSNEVLKDTLGTLKPLLKNIIIKSNINLQYNDVLVYSYETFKSNINEVTRFIEDNSFSYDTYTIDLDFTGVIKKDYVVKLDFGSFSNEYILPVTIENPKITITNPYYADVNINVFNKNSDLIFNTSIKKENFPNNDLKYLFVEGTMAYNEEIKKDAIIFTFDYRRLVDLNNLYLLSNVDPNTINQDFKFSSSYLINDKVIEEPYYILEINENNFSEYPNLNIVVNFKDVEAYTQSIDISNTFETFEDYYEDVYNNYVSKNFDVENNENFFEGLTKAFEHFQDKIKIILQDLDYFFTSLSNDFKYYFYIIFAIGLFGIFLRFIL